MLQSIAYQMGYETLGIATHSPALPILGSNPLRLDRRIPSMPHRSFPESSPLTRGNLGRAAVLFSEVLTWSKRDFNEHYS